MRAMEHWMSYTCLRFELGNENDTDYILFTEAQG